MKLPRRKFLHLAAGAAALPAVSRVAWAQAYPSRPVRIIVPFAPAGAREIVARMLAQGLAASLGRLFVAATRQVAGTHMGTEPVARAPADGSTFPTVAPAAAVHATLFDKLNFNFLRDIAPVAGFIRSTHVLVVNPSLAAKTVPEFIPYAH